MSDSSRQEFAHKSEHQGLFSLLPDDLLDKCFSFVGSGYYRYVSGVCKRFRHVYYNERSRTKDTFWRCVTTSVPCAELCLDDQEQLGRTSEEKQGVIATIGSKAIELGKVEVLAWAHGNGCILNEIILWQAGSNGHVNVLEWAHSNNIEWHGHGLVFHAVSVGHVHVLDFVLDKEPPPFDRHYDLTNCACQFGQIIVLEWLKEKQLLPSNDNGSRFMNTAASHGQITVLDWMCREGYLPSIKIVDRGASGGHIDVLQWARDRGIRGSTDACAMTALRGHLNALQWLRENGCPWDSRVISYAAREGHGHVLDWARENGCPEPDEIVLF